MLANMLSSDDGETHMTRTLTFKQWNEATTEQRSAWLRDGWIIDAAGAVQLETVIAERTGRSRKAGR